MSEKVKRNYSMQDITSLGFEENEVTGGHSFKGEVFDTIYHTDGTIEKRERSFNIVVNDISRLISALIKHHNGHNEGNLYWALGTGQDTWDDTPYTPLDTNTKLTNEVFRKAILPEQRTFVDENGEPTSEVTNRLQLNIVIESTEANGNSLREFGIFGGNASETKDSGIMINHKSHARIDKVEGMKIERSVRFTF